MNWRRWVYLRDMNWTRFAYLSMIPMSWVFRSYALASMWGWYVTPAFHLPYLSVVEALGITAIMSLLTHQRTDFVKKEEVMSPQLQVINHFCDPFIIPLFAWIPAWIAHFFL